MARMGESERSLEYARQAVEILRRAVESPNPTLAASLKTLGVALRDAGRLDEARRVSEEALAQQIALTGEDSPYAAGCRGQIAAIALDQGDVDIAVRLRREAIEDLATGLGAEHPDVATNWHGLGEALVRQGRPAEADSAFTRALAIRTGVYGDAHRSTRETADALAALRR